MTPSLHRRGFLGLAAAAAGATTLSACGGGPSTSGGSSSSAKASDLDFSGVKPAKEITFWSNHPGASKDIETTLINKFNASQSDTKVTLVTAGATYEDVANKFQTAQQGGQLPHVVIFSDVWWFRYFLNDAIIPLDALIKQVGIETSDFRETLLNDYKYKDQQWAIPYSRSTPVFYYNKDHFKTAGLGADAPKTWQDVAAWAPKLKAAVPSIQYGYMHPAASDYDSWSLQNKLWAWGGALSKEWDITCDSDEVIQAMQFNQDSVYKGKWAGVSSKDAGADFAAGAASMTVGSTGSLVGILKSAKFDVGVGFLPGGPKATDMVCPTGGAGLGIPKAITKEEQLAAANFLKFMSLPENTAAFSEATGYMPTRKSSDMSAVLAKRPQAKVALDQLSHTRSQDYARVFLPGADREIGMAASDIMTQQADPKQRFTQLKSTLQGIYDKQVKPKLS